MRAVRESQPLLLAPAAVLPHLTPLLRQEEVGVVIGVPIKMALVEVRVAAQVCMVLEALLVTRVAVVLPTKVMEGETVL